MNKIASRGIAVILLILVLVGGFTFFVVDYMANSGNWVSFPGSPHVYYGNEVNIGCGYITDRNGVPILDLRDGRIYSTDEQLRSAMVHWVGDRGAHISAPAFSEHSLEMIQYDLFNGVYSYGNADTTAKLTLSADIQKVALEALGEYSGTIGVYNYKTGELLCAVTTPTFDPDNVSTVLDSMYRNRFVQSTYIPGSIFKIVTLAAALESIPDILEQKFTCSGSYQIGADTITCDGKHHTQSLKQAFRNSCNCAFAQLAQMLGAETLSRYVKQFGVVDSVSFDGIETKQGNFDLQNAAELNVAWSAIGQYTDKVNACSFMTFVGAIANGGKGKTPYLVQEIVSNGSTVYEATPKEGDQLMSTATAEIIREYMGFNVSNKYGSDNFPGLTVCAKTGTAEVDGGKKPNAVFTGFVEDEEYPFAFIAIVEDGGYGREISMPMVAKVLAACKEVTNNG